MENLPIKRIVSNKFNLYRIFFDLLLILFEFYNIMPCFIS